MAARPWTGLARRLAEQGWAAFSIDYRLAPPSPFPAAFDDVQTAIRWVRGHARSLQVDRTRVALFGASAGANLALLAATRGRGPLDRGTRVRAVVSWSGPTDLTSFVRETTNRYATSVTRAYLGCAPASCPTRYADASPTTFVDHTDPPALLVNSTHEIVPLQQARELVRRLAAANVPNRLIVLAGSRHAIGYLQAAWGPTLRFLARRLGH